MPANADPLHADLAKPDERARLARLLLQGLERPAGFVLPLRAPEAGADAGTPWRTSPWPLKRERLYLLPGDSPIGLRLPLASLPEVLPEDIEAEYPVDPFALARRSAWRRHGREAQGEARREGVRSRRGT